MEFCLEFHLWNLFFAMAAFLLLTLLLGFSKQSESWCSNEFRNHKTKQYLLVGDSEAGALSYSVKRNSESGCWDFKFLVGSRTAYWKKEVEKIDDNYNIIFISLGANDYANPKDISGIVEISKWAERHSNECIWVGPPKLWNKDSNVVKTIKNTTTCKFFDSSAEKIELTSDLVHPTYAGADFWLKKVLEQK